MKIKVKDEGELVEFGLPEGTTVAVFLMQYKDWLGQYDDLIVLDSSGRMLEGHDTLSEGEEITIDTPGGDLEIVESSEDELNLDEKTTQYIDHVIRQDIKETRKRIAQLKPKPGQHPGDFIIVRQHKEEKVKFAISILQRLPKQYLKERTTASKHLQNLDY